MCLTKDINECVEYESYGLCDENADCINSVGSYECKCRAGYKNGYDDIGIFCVGNTVSIFATCHCPVIVINIKNFTVYSDL